MARIPQSCGVVLDLDDTLYPERSYHVSGFRWIAERTGLDPDGPVVQAAARELRAGGRPLDLLSDSTGIPVPTLLEWHRAHPPSIELYPDASRFLARTRNAGIPCVLLTDGRSQTQRQKMEALGLSHAFRAVLISEETGMDKHQAGAFVSAGSHLRDRWPLIYFGDNPIKDIGHPLAEGWTVFLMKDRGDNVHPQDGPQPESVTVLSSFDEVVFETPDRISTH